MVKDTGNNHIVVDEGSFKSGQPYIPPPIEEAITYTYPATSISNKEIQLIESDKNKKHISLIFSPGTKPNFTFASTNNFKAEKLYITKVVHNIIPGLTEHNNELLDTDNKPAIIGELIIEHNKTADNTKKLYACFFLKKNTSGANNNFDSLISLYEKTDQTEQIAIDDDIPEQPKALSYDSNGHKIVVFLEPILINPDKLPILSGLNYDMADKFKGTNENIKKNDVDISTENKKTYNIHGGVPRTITPIVGTRTVNNDVPDVGPNSDYYLNCNPAGESAETIGTYNIPINSEYSDGATVNEANKTVMNFIIFSFIIGIVYFAVPNLYFMLVYVRYLDTLTNSSLPNKARGVRNFDWILVSIFVLLVILFVSDGSPYSISIMIYSIFFFGLSIIAIFSNKNNSGDWIKKIDYGHDDLKTFNTNWFPQNPDGASSTFLGDFFKTILYATPFGPNKAAFALWFIIIIIFVLIMSDPAKIIFSDKDRASGKGGNDWFKQNAWGFTGGLFALNALIGALFYIGKFPTKEGS